MASAPPMESFNVLGQPQPPSYEETIAAPKYDYSHAPAPPVSAKMPQPVYHHQAYNHVYPEQSNAAVTSPPVTVQTIYVQSGMVFGDFPVQVHCPVCEQMVLTRLAHSNGNLTWLACVSLSLVGCFYGCCLIPFCVNTFKDVTHNCPTCNSVLGVYKRL